MIIRKGYEFKNKQVIILDSDDELKEEYQRKYKERRVFVSSRNVKKWAKKATDIEVTAPNYKNSDAINTDPDNPIIKHFEKQSGGYEDELFKVFIKKENIMEWDRRFKNTPGINY